MRNLAVRCALSVALAGACGSAFADNVVVTPSQPASTTANPLPSAKALIIFYRTAHFEGAGLRARVSINDKQFCGVANHDVCTSEQPAGSAVFKIDDMLSFGQLDFPMTLEGGKIYFVELAADTSAFMGGAAA